MVVIEGLKLTMTGVQLRALIDGRIQRYEDRIADYTKQLKTPASEEKYPLPGSVLEGEISRGEQRIDVLTFIRKYIVADEVYRLGEFDLRFVDLLPEEEWECDCLPSYRVGQGFGSAHAPVEQT